MFQILLNIQNWNSKSILKLKVKPTWEKYIKLVQWHIINLYWPDLQWVFTLTLSMTFNWLFHWLFHWIFQWILIDSFPKGGLTLMQLEGVNETQLHWLDLGKVGTPLVMSSLNGLADMRGPESWQTNKLIESEIMLNLGLH